MTEPKLSFDRTDISALNARRAEPLYHQLYLIIKSKIEQGVFKQGDTLPSELSLVAIFGVSRITAKRALDELANDDLVERARGRGTQVKYRYIPNVLRAPLTGMLESLVVMGKETTVDVLSLERVVVPAHLRAPMHLRADDSVERAVRIRRNQNDAFGYYVSYTHLPKGGNKHFTAKALRTQPRLELFRQMGIRLTEVDQVLTAVAANSEVAAALGVSVGAPLLGLTRNYMDQAGVVVDHLQGMYRPDRFQYHMRMSTTNAQERKS
jgi:GntR family transcriptional regulator